ncbi:MAG: hypothetical protein K8W52_17365 [Deltaproteobacteria bacterium]|nr:hypothetical protein [Deltaproteobacteria bacterium]
MRAHLAFLAAIGLALASPAPAHAVVPTVPDCPSCTSSPFDLGDPYVWVWIAAFRW